MYMKKNESNRTLNLIISLLTRCCTNLLWILIPHPRVTSAPHCVKTSGSYLLTSSVNPVNHYPKDHLYSCRVKIEQLMVTQWYTAYTRRYTVGSLLFENAMASPA